MGAWKDLVGCALRMHQVPGLAATGIEDHAVDAGFTGEFARHFDMGPAAHEAGTGRELNLGLRIVGIGCDAAVEVHLEALELLVEDEVDLCR